MTKSELVVIRDMVPTDLNFILASFLRGVYYGDEYFIRMPKNLFMEKYHAAAMGLLARPDCVVKIACAPDDLDVLRGYAISTPRALDWVFVKKEWRGIGIARDLVPPTIPAVTHLTKAGLSIIRKHNIDFNPFAL